VAQSEKPHLDESSAQIKVYPFEHPHTKWKDPDRVTLKVRKGDMSPADFKATLKHAGIELHPEFPKIITGGVYEIAVVRKKDWEAHGKKIQAGMKAAPKAPPKKKEPMSLEGMKLSPAEMTLLHQIGDAELGPLYGGHPSAGDLALNPKHDMKKINLVAGMMNKKWKDTDGKQKSLLYVHAEDTSWAMGPFDPPEIVTLKTPSDVRKAAKKGSTIYVSTHFSTWAGSGKATHSDFFWHHKKAHGH